MTQRHEISAREAARRLSVDAATIIRWLKAGKMTGWQTPGGHWRIDPSEVERLRRGATVPDGPANHLYYGDNLEVLRRYIALEDVALLEQLEDALDALDALEGIREAETEGTISLEELRARLLRLPPEDAAT